MWVEVRSGLTSRFMTITDAYYLVKNRLRGGQRLNIVWPLEEECNISYEEIFEKSQFADIDVRIFSVTPLHVKLMKAAGLGGVKNCIKKRNIKGAFAVLIAKLDRKLLWRKARPLCIKAIFGNRYYSYNEKSRWEEVDKRLNEGKRLYIWSYKDIIMDAEYDRADVLRKSLVFRKKYWDAVDTVIKPGQKWVGVHIRRTDHEKSIKMSPVEIFIQKMHNILKQEPVTRFFLATDDPEVEDELKDIFGDKITVNAGKEWGRDTAAGIESGLIDCLCLSRCDYILGSYWSTFSRFAAMYGNKKLIIMRKGASAAADLPLKGKRC